MLALNQSPNKLDEVPLEASFYTVSKRHLAAPPASPRAIGLVRKLIRALNRGNRPTLVTTSKALVTTNSFGKEQNLETKKDRIIDCPANLLMIGKKRQKDYLT